MHVDYAFVSSHWDFSQEVHGDCIFTGWVDVLEGIVHSVPVQI